MAHDDAADLFGQLKAVHEEGEPVAPTGRGFSTDQSRQCDTHVTTNMLRFLRVAVSSTASILLRYAA